MLRTGAILILLATVAWLGPPGLANAGERGIDAVELSAQRAGGAARAAVSRPPRSRPYGYIEFIAREDPPTGHSYVRYARLDTAGRPMRIRYAGIYPRYGWAGKIAGSFIPVESETGRHEEDVDSLTLVSFRRDLTAEEYARINAQVMATQSQPAHWHALFFNCNEYVGTLARLLGMTTPVTTWMPAAAYVAAIRAMNTPEAQALATGQAP